jgi:hypothetical protein
VTPLDAVVDDPGADVDDADWDVGVDVDATADDADDV